MSTFTDPTAAAQEHCEVMANHAPDLAEQYQSLATLLQKKLYHQLTVAVLEFVSSPDQTLRTTPDGTSSYLALYDRVVLSVDKKLNQLTLARIASAVADATAPTRPLAGITEGHHDFAKRLKRGGKNS